MPPNAQDAARRDLAPLHHYVSRYTSDYRAWADAVEGGFDGFGRTADPQRHAALTAQRNAHVAELFQPVLGRTSHLISLARTGLEQLPATAPLAGWQSVLDDLDHSAGQIRQILLTWHEEHPTDQHGDPPYEAALYTRNAALWPYLRSWAEHAPVLIALVETPAAETAGARLPSLSAEEAAELLDEIHTARAEGQLLLLHSWFDMAGRRITTAALPDDDLGRTIALEGDPDSSNVAVLGVYDSDAAAEAALPRPAPPGVLRTGRTVTHPAYSRVQRTQKLTHDLLSCNNTSSAAAILYLASSEKAPFRGPLAAVRDLTDAAAEFSQALETHQGNQTADRLHNLSRQLHHLTKELREIADDLADSISVLPPHRVPRPHHHATPRDTVRDSHPLAPRPRSVHSSSAPTDGTLPGAPPNAPTGPSAPARR